MSLLRWMFKNAFTHFINDLLDDTLACRGNEGVQPNQSKRGAGISGMYVRGHGRRRKSENED